MRSSDYYRKKMEDLKDIHSSSHNVKASIIVVTYEPDEDEISDLLDSLDNQTVGSFETIIVDNGSDPKIKDIVERSKTVSKHAVMKENYGLTIGRNVGISLSEGEILIFLDDDGVPRKDFVEEHIKGLEKNDAVALRGRIIPKSEDIFSRLAYHYDLGSESCPYIIDTEGNSSFVKKYLLDIGGFNENLSGSGGHEGVEVTYRLINSGIDKERIIYYPKAVIYHDYISGLDEFLRRKIIRQKKQENLLKKEHPELFEFEQKYESPGENPNLYPSDNVKLLLINIITYITLFLWTHLRDKDNHNKN